LSLFEGFTKNSGFVPAI